MKMPNPAHSLLICLFLFAVTGACVSHDLGDMDTPFVVTCTAEDADISYSSDIAPLITANCIFEGCHGHNSGIPDWREHAELRAMLTRFNGGLRCPFLIPIKCPEIEPLRQKIEKLCIAGLRMVLLITNC